MMYAVHARRDDDAVQLALDFKWQTHVRVVKYYREKREGLPNGEREWRDPNHHDLPGAPAGRQAKLAGVKAQRGRSIQIKINVMCDVETPQERQAMREHVPQVQGVVHQDNSCRHFQPLRKVDALDETPIAPFYKGCERL